MDDFGDFQTAEQVSQEEFDDFGDFQTAEATGAQQTNVPQLNIAATPPPPQFELPSPSNLNFIGSLEQMVSSKEFDLGSMIQPVQNTGPVVSTKNPFAASASTDVAPPQFSMGSINPLDSMAPPDLDVLTLMTSEPVIKSTAQAIKLEEGATGINLVDLGFGTPTMIPLTPEPVNQNQEINNLRFSFDPTPVTSPTMAMAPMESGNTRKDSFGSFQDVENEIPVEVTNPMHESFGAFPESGPPDLAIPRKDSFGSFQDVDNDEINTEPKANIIDQKEPIKPQPVKIDLEEDPFAILENPAAVVSQPNPVSTEKFFDDEEFSDFQAPPAVSSEPKSLEAVQQEFQNKETFSEFQGPSEVKAEPKVQDDFFGDDDFSEFQAPEAPVEKPEPAGETFFEDDFSDFQAPVLPVTTPVVNAPNITDLTAPTDEKITDLSKTDQKEIENSPPEKTTDFLEFQSPSVPSLAMPSFVVQEKATPVRPAEADDDDPIAPDDMMNFDEMEEIPVEHKADDKVISPVKHLPSVEMPDDVWQGFQTDRPTTNTANILDMGIDIGPVAPVQRKEKHARTKTGAASILDTAQISIVSDDPVHLLENVPELSKLREQLMGQGRFKEALDCSRHKECIARIKVLKELKTQAADKEEYEDAIKYRNEIYDLEKNKSKVDDLKQWIGPRTVPSLVDMHTKISEKRGEKLAEEFATLFTLPEATTDEDLEKVIKVYNQASHYARVWEVLEDTIDCDLYLDQSRQIIESLSLEVGQAQGILSKITPELAKDDAIAGYLNAMGEIVSLLLRISESARCLEKIESKGLEMTNQIGKIDILSMYDILGDSIQKVEYTGSENRLCSICLFPTDVKMVVLCGAQYHAPCANFWLNRVSPTPPTFRA